MKSDSITPATSAPETSARFHAILQREWERALRDTPTWATELGDRRHNGRWPDLSLEALAERDRANRAALADLADIDPTALSEADRLNWVLSKKSFEVPVEEYSLQWHFLPLSAREGIQDASTVADAVLFETTQDYEDWLQRLHAFPVYMEQTLGLLREGMRTRMVHARVVMERVPGAIQRQLVARPEESPYFKPFTRWPKDWAPDAGHPLAERARQAIAERVLPAYRKMLEFFTREYLPACSTDVGCWQCPRGEELYAFFAKKFTTTAATPKEIHEIGVAEVKRIRVQMEQIMRDVGFAGTWGEFLEFLRTDPRFRFTDGASLTEAYRSFCASVDVQLPRLFHRLPKIGYDIQPIPMNIAPDTTTAYYRPPSADGQRPGTYFINLYRPELRPRYEIPALSLHEAVPGHHLQIARAMEIASLPPFRRYAPEGAFTGYVEGWALYAESLGQELGCYRDPYDRFGQLTYEIWRAARLVVDTGIHAFRWSRERAIDYFLENTGKFRLDIENEIDRYIAWPGQALAYKMGELEITRLRRRAEADLGSSFDLRDFHEVLLQNGPLPLDVLGEQVQRWIVARSGSPRSITVS